MQVEIPNKILIDSITTLEFATFDSTGLRFDLENLYNILKDGS